MDLLKLNLKEGSMKKCFTMLTVLFMVFTVSAAFAVNKNQSVDYVRTLNRNASTDVDAAFYNPAGIAFLPQNGLYIQVANQTIIQTKTVEDTGSMLDAYIQPEYEGDIRAYYFPNIMAAYKMDNLGFFFHFGPVGGGGGGTYDNGLPQFDYMIVGALAQGAPGFGVMGTGYALLPNTYSRSLSFEGTVFNLGFTAGGAYAINDMMSVAVGYRLTYATRKYEGSVKNVQGTIQSLGGSTVLANAIWSDIQQGLDMTVEGSGFAHSIILGYDIKPMAGMNIGLRYEWNSTLEIEYETTMSGSTALKTAVNTTSYADGTKIKDTEAQLFGLGISYMLLPELKVEVSVTYSLDKKKDLDGAEDNYRNGIFSGIALEYAVMPGFLVSAGYAYGNGSRTDAARSELDYGQPEQHFAVGGRYTIMPGLDLGVGFIYSLYADAENNESTVTGGSQTYSQTSWDIGIGVTYKAI